MSRSRSVRWGLCGLLLLGACATANPASEGVLFRASDWPEVLDQGMAVSALVAAHPITDGLEGANEFTREFVVALQGTAPGTPITGPDEVFARLDRIGPAAHSRLRAVRRSAYRETELDPGPLAALAGELDRRYLLVGWMDEGTAEGLQKTVKDDLNAFSYQMDVHSYSTEEIHGRATAVVLDLLEARAVWRGAVEYGSQWLDWDDPVGARAEIRRTRAAAAVDLAALLGSPGGP